MTRIITTPIALFAAGGLIAVFGPPAPVRAQCGYGTSAQDCYHQQRDQEGARQAAMAAAQQPGMPGMPAAPPPPPADPMRGRLDAATALFELEQLSFYRKAALVKDPRYRAYMDGEWKYYTTPRAGVAPGEFCATLFWSRQGVVILSGPGGDYRGAMLTFLHPDFPRPDKLKTVTVKLWQTGDSAPQKVKAFSYTQRGGAGAVALAVPSLELATDTMLDLQQFKLEVDGKPALDLEWNGGNKARDALRACRARARR